MAMIQRETVISAPVDAVFNYLADISRHGEWAEHKLTLQKSSDGPIGVGTTFESVGHQLGRDFEAQVTITELVTNEKLGYEAKSEQFHFRHEFTVKSENGSTRLSKGVDPVKLSFPFSMLFPVLKLVGVITGSLDGDLRRIKANLEGESAPAKAAAEQPTPPPTPAPEPSETTDAGGSEEGGQPEESA